MSECKSHPNNDRRIGSECTLCVYDERNTLEQELPRIIKERDALRVELESSRAAHTEAITQNNSYFRALGKLAKALGNPCIASDDSLEDGLVSYAIKMIEKLTKKAEAE